MKLISVYLYIKLIYIYLQLFYLMSAGDAMFDFYTQIFDKVMIAIINIAPTVI